MTELDLETLRLPTNARHRSDCARLRWERRTGYTRPPECDCDWPAILAALERIPELERLTADQARAIHQERQRAERDNARQALDRQTDQLAAVLAELPPLRPGTALGLPVHQQVRDLRQRAERLEAAARDVEGRLEVVGHGDHGSLRYCQFCETSQDAQDPQSLSHASDCILWVFRAALDLEGPNDG